MDDLTRLKEVIEQFNQTYPRPGIRLELSDAYNLDVNFKAKERYPGSDRPGVYILLDENMVIQRIGKASCGNDLGNRLGKYFGYAVDGTGEAREVAYAGIRFIVTIKLPLDRAFEAPAIEEYLIGMFNPPLNDRGKKNKS